MTSIVSVPQGATPTPGARIREISRDQYDRECTHGYAGPVAEFSAATAAGWPTPFWSLVLTTAGTALVPTRLLDLPDEPVPTDREQSPRPATPGAEVHTRAEFDPDALAASGHRGPVPDPGIMAVGVDVAGQVRPQLLARDHHDRAATLSILVGVPAEVRCARADGRDDPGQACAGLGVVRLDRADHDLDMWFDIDGAEHHLINPVASAIAAGFGVHGGIYGPVVFTGAPDAHGLTRDVATAATVLIAATAAACDDPHDPDAAARRATEFTALGITITGPDGDPEADLDPDSAGPVAAVLPAPRDSYDALRHTVCRHGDLPRCAECDQHAPHGHDEHHPDQLTVAP